jgi:hypothetical protein
LQLRPSKGESNARQRVISAWKIPLAPLERKCRDEAGVECFTSQAR